MARSAFLLAVSAVLVTTAWFRLETVPVSWRELAPMLLLGLAPAAVLALACRYLVEVPWQKRLTTVAALAMATLLALSGALDIPLSDARPRDPQRNFFGPVFDGIRRGVLDFYETELPFDRVAFPFPHAMVLLAIFAFVALTGLFIVARKAIGAALALVLGIGWPTTLSGAESPLAAGALALAGVLAILFLLRTRDRPVRGAAQATAIGTVLVAVAVGAASSEAVAKGAFLSWKDWDPYDRPDDRVSVSYVWNSNYLGIDFPDKKTTVMRVKVSGPRRSLYWRATTLVEYTGRDWMEALDLTPAESAEEVDVVSRDPLLPDAARDEDNWVRQDITIEALRDTHLIGSAQPVRWTTGTDAPVQYAEGGVIVVPRSLHRGQRYTVWSYVPRPKPSELKKIGGTYAEELDSYLEIFQTVEVPQWDAQNREEWMEDFFRTSAGDFLTNSHRPVYDIARDVTRSAGSPYEAALLLEAWLREDGGFAYDEQPPRPAGAEPALVSFLTQAKRGYCQQYAGAMALMLRMLGIPARVAAGFTSGTYDSDKKEWVVTDHNAHTWVEVYFPGFGWLPFDPTPGRGELSAPYSAFSPTFNSGDAAEAFANDVRGLPPSVAEAIRARERPGLEGVGGPADPSQTGGGGAAAVVRDQGASLVVILLLVLAGGYAAVVTLKALVRGARFATRNPRALAAACRRDLIGYLADQGVEVSQSATLTDLGMTLDRYFAVNAESLVRSLTLARFGPPREAGAAAELARRDLRHARRELRQTLSLASRLRGAARLRSLTS